MDMDMDLRLMLYLSDSVETRKVKRINARQNSPAIHGNK